MYRWEEVHMIFDMSAEKMNTMHRNQTGSFMFDLSFMCPLEYKWNWPPPSQNICQMQTCSKPQNVQIIPRKV